jgi:hypothetical protein
MKRDFKGSGRHPRFVSYPASGTPWQENLSTEAESKLHRLHRAQRHTDIMGWLEGKVPTRPGQQKAWHKECDNMRNTERRLKQGFVAVRPRGSGVQN